MIRVSIEVKACYQDRITDAGITHNLTVVLSNISNKRKTVCKQ